MEKLLINLLARSMQIGNNKFIRHQKKYRNEWNGLLNRKRKMANKIRKIWKRYKEQACTQSVIQRKQHWLIKTLRFLSNAFPKESCKDRTPHDLYPLFHKDVSNGSVLTSGSTQLNWEEEGLQNAGKMWQECNPQTSKTYSLINFKKYLCP